MTELESKDALILHLERTLKLERQTLRDQFAMAVLPSIYSSENEVNHWCEEYGAEDAWVIVAKRAYKLADAMMKVRLE